MEAGDLAFDETFYRSDTGHLADVGLNLRRPWYKHMLIDARKARLYGRSGSK